jgi:hypothetical protein
MYEIEVGTKLPNCEHSLVVGICYIYLKYKCSRPDFYLLLKSSYFFFALLHLQGPTQLRIKWGVLILGA